MIYSPWRWLAPLVVCMSMLVPEGAAGQQWASWRGPAQNGVSDLTGLVSAWSRAGDNLIWSDAWIGRSTPAVFDGRACANGRTGDGVSKQEIVACWGRRRRHEAVGAQVQHRQHHRALQPRGVGQRDR